MMSKINLTVNAKISKLSIDPDAITQTRKEIQDRLKENPIKAPLTLTYNKNALRNKIKEISNQIQETKEKVIVPTRLEVKKSEIKSNIQDMRNIIAEEDQALLIRAGLDVKHSTDKIRKQLEDIIRGVTKQLLVDISVDDKDSGLKYNPALKYQKELKTKAYEVQQYMDSVYGRYTELNGFSDEGSGLFANIKEDIDKAISLEDLSSVRNRLKNIDKMLNSSFDTTKARNDISELTNSLNEIGGSSKEVKKINNQLSQLDTLLDKIEHSDSFEEQKKNVTQFESALRKTQNSINKLKNTKDQRLFDFEIEKGNFENDIAIFKEKYPNAVKKCSKEIEEFENNLNNLDAGDLEGLSNQRKEWNAYTKQLRANGELTDSVFKKIFNNAKKFIQWYGVTGFLSDVVRLLRSMVAEVKAVDTAMVNLKKVTDASDSTFNNFLDRAYSRAKKLGVAVTELINATAEFSRVGYSLDESTVLGEAAVLYKNVGDGITEEEASKSIISTMKAFNIDAYDVTSGIVDKFNEIGGLAPMLYSNI